MPINVVCPGCHKRFSVGEQHAGKRGPCPECKTLIDIPKPEDQVVIHAPDDALGPKDAKGRPVLKTQKAKDAKFSPLLASGVGLAVLLAFAAAFMLRGSDASASTVVLGGAAVLFGPLLAAAGYTVLRDNELEPYRGTTLVVRSLACGLGFAAAWGVYTLLAYQLGGGWPIGSLEIYQMAIAAAAAVGVGAFASYVSLDMDPAVGGVHVALYLAVTILLRLSADLPAIPGLGS
ncbi:MAG: hypothetical protein AAGB00_01505 [Planctomycetota bacterium]